MKTNQLDNKSYSILTGKDGISIKDGRYIALWDENIQIIDTEDMKECAFIDVGDPINKLILSKKENYIYFCTKDSVGALDIEDLNIISSSKITFGDKYYAKDSEKFNHGYIREIFPTDNEDILFLINYTNGYNFFCFCDIPSGEIEIVWHDTEIVCRNTYDFYHTMGGLFYSHPVRKREENNKLVSVDKNLFHSNLYNVNFHMTKVTTNLFTQTGDGMTESLLVTPGVDVVVERHESTSWFKRKHNYSFCNAGENEIFMEIVDTAAKGMFINSAYSAIMEQMVVIYEKSISIFNVQKSVAHIKTILDVSGARGCLFLENKEHIVLFAESKQYAHFSLFF